MKKTLLWPILLGGLFLTACQPSEAAAKVGMFNRFVGDKSNIQSRELALNVQIAEEGFVLLKNKNNTLPFGSDVQKISIFGKASDDMAANGGGSGGGGSIGTTLQKALTDAGFQINTTLQNFYSSSASGSGPKVSTGNYSSTGYNCVGETPKSSYTDAVKNSFAEYHDAALIVISRWGTEGADEKTCDARDFDADGFSERHYLELSKNEEDMFEMVKEAGFQKIVVIINSGNVFQCDKFEKDDAIQGVLWIGTPGQDGCKAVPEILKGTVNPSGRTVDTWAREFRLDPTFQNFADNSQTNLQEINGEKCYIPNDTMLDADGVPMFSFGTDKNYNNKEKPRWQGDGSAYGIDKFPGGTATGEEFKVVKGGLNGVKPAQYISYEEGIYVDYRYYETAYQDMKAKDPDAAEKWYNGEIEDKPGTGVIYPFGYGLSYTTFEQEIVDMNYPENSILNQDCKTIEVKVKVTNTGNVSGKDAVQLYWKAPYKKGGIEKADHVLCAFDKTKELEPGESQELKLSFYLQDVANYDFNDANKNKFKGYELDGGEYSLLVGKDAHEFHDAKKFQVQKAGIKYETDRYTGNKVENRFTDRGFYSSMPGENDIEFTQMSRADFDGTFPTHPTLEDRKVKEGSRFEEFLTHEVTLADIDCEQVLNADGELVENKYEYIPKAAYVSKETFQEKGWSQQATALAKANRTQLEEMRYVELDDPKWDEFLNEFTYDELRKFVADGNFRQYSLDAIGKKQTGESDGPNVWGGILWAGEPIVAATFNEALAKERGELIGLEGGFSGMRGTTWGWLGCGCNTHRSPFGGRNFEYFSADPYLMGRIAARTVAGATEKGVYCYFKHFAVNDQEKGREGVSTFINEQALREVYLKSFQMVFQDGKTIGVMSSYNRLGNMETAASYPLLTEVTRNEWGFKGTVLSDMTHSGNGSVNFNCYENVNWRVLAGMNVNLDSGGFGNYIEAKWDAESGCPTFKYQGDTYESYSWWYAVRKSAKEQMWMSIRSGMYESVTPATEDILANDRYDFRVGQAVNETIGVKEGVEGTLSVDQATPLPAGLTFENGVLGGTPTKDCVVRVNFLLTNGTDVKGKIVELAILPANGEAGDKSPKGCAGGCSGTMNVIAITSLLGVALAGLLTVRGLRKKEEK